MKIQVWPADTDACAAYRLEFPARAVAAATGWEVDYKDRPIPCLWDTNWEGLKVPPASAKLLAIGKVDADVVVMQRPTRKHWSEMIPFIQEQGVRVVVDMDDNFDAIPRTHVSYKPHDPALSPARNREWARAACRLADVVTVTTPALLEHYGFGHGVVLPNLVPESYLKVEPEAKMMAVGWSGSVATHPGDLQVTGGAVGRALRDCPGWSFHVIGTGAGVADALGLDEEPSNTGTSGWVSFRDYPAKLAEIGVGVVPLEDSVFNRGKSALKLLEMSAVGVATVASPTPDNVRVHGLGMGELAAKPVQWHKKLRALMRSRDYLEDVVGRSRQAAATQTYEVSGWRWAEAWDPRSRPSNPCRVTR